MSVISVALANPIVAEVIFSLATRIGGPLLVSLSKAVVAYVEGLFEGSGRGKEKKVEAIKIMKEMLQEQGISVSWAVNMVLSPLIDAAVSRMNELTKKLEDQRSATAQPATGDK